MGKAIIHGMFERGGKVIAGIAKTRGGARQRHYVKLSEHLDYHQRSTTSRIRGAVVLAAGSSRSHRDIV